MKYVEFRYYVDGVLYKIDRIKRDAREKDDDENAWWFPVTSHSSELNDVTFNFGTYPMFRSTGREKRENRTKSFSRGQRKYTGTMMRQQTASKKKEIRSRVYTRRSRGPRYTSM